MSPRFGYCDPPIVLENTVAYVDCQSFYDRPLASSTKENGMAKTTAPEDGIVSIDQHNIPAKEERLIYAQNAPGRPFHCEKLMVWESSVGGTSISRIMAGEKARIVDEKTDPVKSTFFGISALGNGIGFNLLSTEKLGLLVRNDTDSDLKVSAAVFGKFVE